MFDDIDNTPRTTPASPSPQPRPRPIQPMPPTNLPLGGQPIVAPLPQQPRPAAPVSPSSGVSLPEDIFSPTDTIPIVTAQSPEVPPPPSAPGPLPPFSPYDQSAPVITPLGGMEEMPHSSTQPPPLPEQRTGGLRKVLVFFLSALVVAFLGIGGYLVYRIIQTKTGIDVLNQPIESGMDDEGATTEPEEPTEEEPESGVVDDGAEAETAETDEEPEEVPSAPEEPQQPPADSDNDGLNDLEELELGSNPRVIDTDLDGLDDYSEARVYRSHPVIRDTDGDGYDDGLEVQNGYSPTGPGRLTSE